MSGLCSGIDRYVVNANVGTRFLRIQAGHFAAITQNYVVVIGVFHRIYFCPQDFL
jgi:hypothetical protein